MVIEELPLDQLKPAEYNPREISEEEFAGLKESLREFGQRENLVVNKDMTIISGHQRYEAMKVLGMTTAFCDIVDLDKHQEKKLNVIMNSQAISGKYDDLKLSEILEELKLDDDYESLRLDKLEPLDLSDVEIEEDEAPEVSQEPPVSKLGEVYQLGRHRVMCGDSLKDIDMLMGDTKATMIFTDPPYNVDYGSSKPPRHKIRSIENDSLSDDEWAEFNSHLAQTMSARCSGDVYIFGAPSPDGMRARLAYVDAGFHWSATIIWKKQQLVLSPAKYQRIYEPCFYGWHDNGKSSFVGDRKQVELWEIDRPLNSKEHPTMKPIELCAKGIQNSSNKNDIVLDLFLGSGSTLIACEQTDRTCYGMELDPKYVDVIRKRYWKFTNDGNEEGWEEGTPKV